MSQREEILLVSKPVVPPWNDSGKNLVRDIAAAGQRYDYRIMATRGAVAPGPRAKVDAVYSAAGLYSPGLKQNLAVLLRLLKPDRQRVYHFFFAPNPKTSKMARTVLRLKRRRAVHTICSVPATFEGIKSLMFAHRIVALSEHTRGLLESHGVENVVHIPPCIPAADPMPAARKEAVVSALQLPARPLVVFPGDYQFSSAARICADALPSIVEKTDAHFVFACRIKQEQSRQIESGIRGLVTEAGVENRVSFFNEVDDMEALAAAAALVVLPADSLYAKMDIPLVLLEALREEVPIVVSDHGPLAELVSQPVGVAAPVGNANAFADAVSGLLGNPDRRRDMGKKGRELVLDRYTPETVSARYEKLYDELLS